ncbi:MAG: protein kinase [Polyangiaceae bacterium]|nr:protein kinase [Polyangiaceae bacterium]
MARVPLPPAETMKLTTLAEIASGGMGSVEMARVESGRLAGETLAIKRLHSSIANDPTFVDMFLDEAWLTAAMKSPHVMGVVAHGTDDRGMFLAVELIEGVPLSRLLKEARVKREIFSEQVVSCIATQICEGLIEAHGLQGTDGKVLGLVHRDLTPGNVLVSFDGLVKIVDFGIAKAEERITHTRTGTMKGKPAYMAPEQAKGSKNIDLRADIFSFGVMIFEFLAGRRPWIEKSAFDVIMAAALKPHPDINQLRPGISSVWGEIIDKCLAKKASDRWASAAEIRDRLIAWRKEQNFTKTDVEVLREFVLKCSQAQIEWFRRARSGEFAKGNAQTFKELEEAIDEARKRSGEAPMSIAPTSSGRSVFDQITPSRAQPTITGANTPRPASGAEPTPKSAIGSVTGAPIATVQRAGSTMPSLSEASRQAQRLGQSATPPPVDTITRASQVPTRASQAPSQLNATIALSESDLEVGDLAQGGQFGPATGIKKSLGGTEFMEVSPLKGMKLPDPRIESDSSSDLQATIRMPELSDRPIRDVESRSVIRPAGVHAPHRRPRSRSDNAQRRSACGSQSPQERTASCQRT